MQGVNRIFLLDHVMMGLAAVLACLLPAPSSCSLCLMGECAALVILRTPDN